MYLRLLLLSGVVCVLLGSVFAAPATGPLRVLASNPRYFTDGSGKAIYLTGSHTWCNFATAQGKSDPPLAFDFNAYLDFLASHNHNFFRGWIWELAYSDEGFNTNGLFRWSPHPWLRTGPGDATDGKPKFDLTRFNSDFFDRIRSRAKAAGERGFYVSIMLFQGYGVQFNRNPVDGYPLDGRNNINGVDGGAKTAAHTLEYPDVTAVQDAYVRRLIDTVDDLDNVLFEISNESGSYSTAWQHHMIDLIHRYEAQKPKQHPVGMTYEWSGGTNEELFNSPADWISPCESGGYGDLLDPPAADGRKVIINDTDHSFYFTKLLSAGPVAQQSWVWRNLTRGNQTLFMDPYLARWEKRNNPIGINPQDAAFGLSPDPYWETLRNALGRARSYATKVDLARMTPQNALSSTAYCLADPGHEYLVYQPNPDSAFTVNLAAGTYTFEWYDPSKGTVASRGRLTTDAGSRSYAAPFSGDAVLYITDKPPTAPE